MADPRNAVPLRGRRRQLASLSAAASTPTLPSLPLLIFTCLCVSPAAALFALPRPATLPSTSAASSPPRPFDLHVRFSPLVGGPRFLPLHVEVVLAPPVAATPTPPLVEGGDDDRDPPGNGEGTSSVLLHRFDYLPRDPTDPATIFKLLTLRSVPGEVRRRTAPSLDGIAGGRGTKKKKKNGGGGGGALAIRLGSVGVSTTPGGKDVGGKGQDALSRATEYALLHERESGDELNLLSNNCLTFACGLVAHLRGRVGGGSDEAKE